MKTTALGLVLLGLLAAPCYADVTLAQDGRTDYTIIHDINSTDNLMNLAVRDLADYLQKSTQAVFPIQKEANGPKIYIGVTPETDKEPCQSRERRIRAIGQDIYFYGDFRYGTVGAIYEFLQKFLGCRWYTTYGDEKVPVHSTLTFKELNSSHVPSLKSYEHGSRWPVIFKDPYLSNFVRRNNTFVMPNYAYGAPDDAWNYIGPVTHTLHAYLPPGGLKPRTFNDQGKFYAGPHMALKDKEYFKTNPEYYSLMKDGKRSDFQQVCFSNPEVRRTLLENIEKVIQYEHYDPNTYAVLDFTQNDHSSGFCYCPECQAKNEKYQTPGGTYFDFLLELGEYFGKKYPKITFRFFAYQEQMTGIPPVGIEHFPKNISVILAPLQQDLSKPFSHEYNQIFLKQMQKWGKLVDEVWFWNYPTLYTHGMQVYALLPNLYRNIENLKLGYDLGVRYIIAEQGGSIVHGQAFKDLNAWVLSQMADDIHQDTDALIKEFCDFCYDDASELMQQYIKEADAECKKDPGYFIYHYDPRIMKRVNSAENLVRWQTMFNEMEARLAQKPLKVRHVRRARLNLDAVSIMVYPAIRKACPEFAKTETLDKIYARYCAELKEDAEWEYPLDNPKLKADREGYINHFTERGVRQFYVMHKKGEPAFPQELVDKYGKDNLLSVPFNPNRSPLDYWGDDSATGSALACVYKDKQDFGYLEIFMTTKQGFPWRGQNYVRFPFCPVDPKNKAMYEAKPGFNVYYCGECKLTPGGAIMLRQKNERLGRVYIGYHYDEKNPDQKYDVYISVKGNGDTFLVDRFILGKKVK